MSGRSLARRVARRGAAILPPGPRGALFRGLAPRLGVAGAEHGLVSVVVVCEDVDVPRLDACLASLRSQTHGYREVLVAPVGDRAQAAVAGLASPDPRLRRLPVSPTWQDAANRAAPLAHGDHLLWHRACDLLPDGALGLLARTLAASGSDLAVGLVAQRGDPEEWLRRAQQRAHRRPGTALAPADRPDLAGDLAVGNRMVRLDSWRAAGLAWGPDDDWLCSPTVARLLAAAARIDVLGAPTTEYLPDHGTRAFGAMPSSLPEVDAWRRRATAVEDALAGTPLADGWREHVLDVGLPRFLKDAERATDDQWADLRALVATYDGAGAGNDVRAESRTLLRLAADDRRADVEAVAAEAHELGHELRTELVDGAVLARWEALPPDAVPPVVRRLTATETPLVAEVRRLRRDAAVQAEVEVDLVLRVEHLDLSSVPVELAVTLPDGTPLDARTQVDADATRWAGSRFHAALATRVRAPAGTGELHLRLDVAGLHRTTRVPLVDPLVRDPSADGSVVVRSIELDRGHLVVEAEGADRLRLVDERGEVVRTPRGNAQRVRFDLSDPGPRSGGWLPTGRHWLRTPHGTPAISEELAGRIPREQVGRHYRLRTLTGPAGGLVVGLQPPLDDDEQGPWAQQRLVERYAATEAPVRTGTFYFESYAGRSATDSPLAIFVELQSRRPDLTAYWGVSDHAQWVPEGAVPVLIGSRDWFDLLATAACLVVNTDFEPWFRRRPGQFVLQTFHGYPSKGMGEGQWRAKDLPPSVVARFRARGVDTWSAILTPTPEMTRHYREQYGYEGLAFERGYPRDDALTGPAASRTRAATRAALGIRDDQTAVLYAPTWRDHLATRPRGAEMADHLDVQRAAAALGDSHVLLLRGHRFHDPEPTGAQVVDVTRHPEVNDLLLAADVAVLDYSSLRFDFALTGKPMVFLVPDLADYGSGTRSFLFPFEDSAPGPLVDGTDEVVALVRDVAALREQWAERLAAFNAEYQPWQDGHASARVVDGLLALLDLPTP